MLHARRVGGETFVARPLALARHVAELRELAVVAHGQDHVAVGGREILVRHDVRVRVAHAARHRAADQVVGGLVGQAGDLHVQQRQVDVLARAGAVAVRERGQHADGGVQAGEDVGERDAHLLRPGPLFALGAAGDAHQPAHALDQEVVAGALRVRAGLAEAGDRAVDEAGLHGQQAGVVEPVLLEAADLEVLQHDIGFHREAAHQRLAFGVGDVDRDRALVAVGAEVVRGVARLLAGRVLQPGRAPRARVVAGAGALHLDDVGAEIGQQLSRPRAREHAREVQHLDALQGARRRRHGELRKRRYRSWRDRGSARGCRACLRRC